MLICTYEKRRKGHYPFNSPIICEYPRRVLPPTQDRGNSDEYNRHKIRPSDPLQRTERKRKTEREKMSVQPTKWVLNNNQPCPTSPHIHYSSPDYDLVEVVIHIFNNYLKTSWGIRDQIALASMNYLLEIKDRKFQRKS